MSSRARSVVLLTAGVLLFLVALTADSLGLGGTPGVGYKQVLVAFAGMILAAFGMAGMRTRGGS
jgi:hypothetical protein